MKTNIRDKKVNQLILIEGLFNIIVLVVKLLVWLSTGSLAVLSDAIHSLTDVCNNIVVWFVVRLASSPPDAGHPYGHKKFETLVIFGLASLLVVLAFELLQSAFDKPVGVASNNWALAAMLLVLLANISIATWQKWWSKRLQSDVLYADATHTFADVFTSFFVIIGWQISTLGLVWADRAAAIIMCAFILFLSFKLFQRSVPILVDQAAMPADVLTDVAKKTPGVIDVINVRSRWIGSSLAVDMSIVLERNMTVENASRICSVVESHLKSRLDVKDVVIQVEPSLSL